MSAGCSAFPPIGPGPLPGPPPEPPKPLPTHSLMLPEPQMHVIAPCKHPARLPIGPPTQPINVNEQTSTVFATPTPPPSGLELVLMMSGAQVFTMLYRQPMGVNP